MRVPQPLIPLLLTASVPWAQAAPVRDAIRVAVDGQTRVVRTVGRPSDNEFYAPLAPQLRSLWLDVRPNGVDRVEVRYQGSRAALWPVVTSEEELPPNGRQPTVLREGNELLVPVRALVALGNGMADWDDRAHTLTLTPTVRRLELHPTERGVELRLEASAPVHVTSVRLSNPTRLAIDITPAWFNVTDLPAPVGPVRSLRLGQFTKQTARLVMELSGGSVAVSGLPQFATVISARLRPGGEQIARTPGPAPESLEAAGSSSSPSSPAQSETSPAPADTTHPAPAAPARPSRRGHLRRLTIHRGLASRGGFADREINPLTGSARSGVLAGKVIWIDPGHGGWKSGANGLNGLKEGDACLAMAKQAERSLQEAGATVVMSREDDRYVSLEDRYNSANAKQADLFISIHCNAMQQHNTMSGTETYYWSPQSLDLARAIHPEVVQAMGGRDGGIRRRAFAVIHHTTMPSILIEVGYIDNVNDETKLGDPGFQEQLGNAIRDGVLRYFGG